MTETRHLSIVPTVPGNCPDLPLGSPAKFAWGPEDVAAALNICVRALLNLRKSDPTFPAPRMLGTTPRWSPTAIHHWLFTAPTAAQALDAAAEVEAGPKPAVTKPVKPNKTPAERRRDAAAGRQPGTGRSARARQTTPSEGARAGSVSEMWHV